MPVNVQQYALSTGRCTGRTNRWNSDSTWPLTTFNRTAGNSMNTMSFTSKQTQSAGSLSLTDDFGVASLIIIRPTSSFEIQTHQISKRHRLKSLDGMTQLTTSGTVSLAGKITTCFLRCGCCQLIVVVNRIYLIIVKCDVRLMANPPPECVLIRHIDIYRITRTFFQNSMPKCVRQKHIGGGTLCWRYATWLSTLLLCASVVDTVLYESTNRRKGDKSVIADRTSYRMTKSGFSTR